MSLRTVIHGEKLASRKMLPEHKNVLNDVIKVVKYIKANGLNSHLFEQFCEDIAEHKCLLLHTEVRWLSKGRSLAIVF